MHAQLTTLHVRLPACREELSQLENAVQASRNLIVILTDKIFESEW